MHELKIKTVSGEPCVILTSEIMAHLKARDGDTLYLTKISEGSFRLTSHDSEFARQMALADEIMHEDREILRTLAK